MSRLVEQMLTLAGYVAELNALRCGGQVRAQCSSESDSDVTEFSQINTILRIDFALITELLRKGSSFCVVLSLTSFHLPLVVIVAFG